METKATFISIYIQTRLLQNCIYSRQIRVPKTETENLQKYRGWKETFMSLLTSLLEQLLYGWVDSAHRKQRFRFNMSIMLVYRSLRCRVPGLSFCSSGSWSWSWNPDADGNCWELWWFKQSKQVGTAGDTKAPGCCQRLMLWIWANCITMLNKTRWNTACP